MSQYQFSAALGNGPIVEVVPDVFAVEGKFFVLPGAWPCTHMLILLLFRLWSSAHFSFKSAEH